MRKFVISLAAAGTALAFASPASAQYYPQPQQPYGYGTPSHGYGGYGAQPYGYNNGYGQVRTLQARIDRIEYQIQRFDRRDQIRNRSADQLRREARSIEKRLRSASRSGLNPYEANDIAQRIARLEQRVQYAMGHNYNRYGYNGYNNGGYNVDRDRDGRDDRYEDDRGRDRDD